MEPITMELRGGPDAGKTKLVNHNNNVEIEMLLQSGHQDNSSETENSGSVNYQQQSAAETTNNDKLMESSIGAVSSSLVVVFLVFTIAVFLTTTSSVATATREANNGNDEVKSLVQVVSQSGTVFAHRPTAARQIENYRQGSALILNVNILHHAGTTFCRTIGRAPGTKDAPTFDCKQVLRPDDNGTASGANNFPPWTHDETATKIELVRPLFHMLSWEYSQAPAATTSLSDTDWEDENLVSVIILRDPIARMLAEDDYTARHYSGIRDQTASLNEWWDFADDPFYDNFALRILAGNGCCHGKDTERRHLETAQHLIERFTFVLDMACLDAGMQALANVLNIATLAKPKRTPKRSYWHEATVDRIPYKEVYNYLLQKFQLDIELYEWSKTLSLVNCSALLPSAQEGGST